MGRASCEMCRSDSCDGTMTCTVATAAMAGASDPESQRGEGLRSLSHLSLPTRRLAVRAADSECGIAAQVESRQ